MTTICPQPEIDLAQSLGYAFDPVPAALKLDRRLGHLIDFDLVVVSEMVAIGRWRGRRDSCWVTKAVLADRLGVTTRTVQSAWSRLKARGWILEEQVGPHDPDDPRNRTGRRYFFGWTGERREPARFDTAPGPIRRGPRPHGEPPGEQSPSLPAEKALSPNMRENSIPEKTTDGSVVMAPPGTRAQEVEEVGRPSTPHVAPPTAQPSALPLPLAEALDDPTIGPALRRKLTAAFPKWIDDGHPPRRVVAAVRAMLEAVNRGAVRTPIGYIQGTLTNMAVEGDEPAALTPPVPPSRVPNSVQTAIGFEEIRRGEEQLAARQGRWEALSEAEQAEIVANDARANPRPPGTHARLWAIARHAACLELMDTCQLSIRVTLP